MTVMLVSAGLLSAVLAGCGGDDPASTTPQAATAPPAATASTPAATASTPTATAPATIATATTTTPRPTTPSPSSATPATPGGGAGEAAGAWVRSLCTQTARLARQVKPPTVDPSGQDATASLVRFLSTVDDQVRKQRDGMARLGAPPIAGAQAAYRQALGRLDDVRGAIGKVRAAVEKADPKDPADMSRLFQRLGSDMRAFSSYRGPVADLAERNRALRRAIAAERSCRSLR